MTGQRRCVVVASVLWVIAAAAPAWAAPSTATPAATEVPSLAVVGLAEGPQVVPVSKTARGQRLTAALPIVVRNDSPTAGTLEPQLAQQKGGGDVVIEPRGARVKAHDIAAITLRFTAKGTAPSIDGTVLLRIAGEPSVRPVVFQVAGKPAPDATFAQKTTKFTVTRIFGPVPAWLHKTGLLHGKADVPLHGAASLQGSDPSAQALLTADNGRTARIMLHQATRKPGGNYVALADVTDITHAGEYGGVLPLDPADPKSSSSEVTVKVQDLLLFPLLMVFLGAALGGYGRRRWEQWRERQLLRERLQDKVGAYDKARAGHASHEPNLDARIGTTGNGTFPRRYDPADTSLELNRLWAKIAAADDVDQLAAATTATDALIADIDRFLALDGALDDLRAAHHDLPTRAQLAADRGSLSLQDTRLIRVDSEVLGQGIASLEDGDAVTAFTTRVRRQAAIAEAFRRTWHAWRTLAPEGHEAGSPGHAALNADDPRRIYRDAPREVDRTKRDTANLLRRLEVAAGELRWYAEHPDVAHTVEAAKEQAEAQTEVTDVMGTPSLAIWSGGLPGSLAPVAQALGLGGPHRPTPERTRAAVRRWDWTMFLLVATVTAVAYLLPLYVGTSWGSWDDYLTAFVAGAASTVLLPWELLPMFRSDRNPAKAAAADA